MKLKTHFPPLPVDSHNFYNWTKGIFLQENNKLRFYFFVLACSLLKLSDKWLNKQVV